MDWKTICKKLLTPPIWLTLLLTLISIASLIFVFVKGWETSPIASISYALSFYTLTIITIYCTKVFPTYYRKAKNAVYSNKFGNRYFTDVAFKTHVSLYRSLSINLLYVVFNLASGLWYKTYWFIVLAFYYVILAVMRFLLVRYVNKNAIGEKYIAELRRSRLCGIILLAVNLVLTGAVLMMMYQDKGYEYHGIMIYIMAMYTFYITTYAIINIIKYRKYNSPIMSTTKIITLAAAMVSMLSLETAMLTEFGSESVTPYFRQIMIAATGAGVSIIVITLSVYMIVKATGEIRKIKNQNS